MVVSNGVWSPGFNPLITFCCWASTRLDNASARLISKLSVCRANWWENMIDSTSIPFIKMTRVRV